MALLLNISKQLASNTAYHLVRRAQAKIASYQHFGDGDLEQYLERDAFCALAKRLANHYFHRSRNLAIYEQVRDLYHVLLIMAPIIQKLPLSYRLDWHRGHLMSFFRIHASAKIGRFHISIREIERRYQPDKLASNLEALGIHDVGMVELLMDLYRRHCGGTALKDKLAYQLFDPIMLVSEKQGYELRVANRLYRFEKQPFEGSKDLRRTSMTILDFSIKSVEHRGGRHLEISISNECITDFRNKVDRVLESAGSPAYKVVLIEGAIRDLIERIRSARSSKQQILELKHWLSQKLRRLTATYKHARQLPELLVNLWLQRCDYRLHLKSPNFFMDPLCIEEKTYINFFSPYREV